MIQRCDILHVTCDAKGCSAKGSFVDSGGVSARYIANRYGWAVMSMSNTCLCPKHNERYTQEEALRYYQQAKKGK